MNILISHRSKQPIYEQIKQQIEQQIFKGLLKANDTLPSIRQLAKELGISVITSKKAYETLEKEGYIYSVVGKGSFVSANDMNQLKKIQVSIVGDKLKMIIDDCKNLDMSLADITQLIAAIYKEEG